MLPCRTGLLRIMTMNAIMIMERGEGVSHYCIIVDWGSFIVENSLNVG